MKSFAVARVTDGVITKGEIYPITFICDGLTHIKVKEDTVIIVLCDDTDFTFYINCEDDFNVPKTN